MISSVSISSQDIFFSVVKVYLAELSNGSDQTERLQSEENLGTTRKVLTRKVLILQNTALSGLDSLLQA